MTDIVFAADHAGFELKQKLISHFANQHRIIDLGTNSTSSIDYPDIVAKLATYFKNNNSHLGVLLCGSGSGVCIAANRYSFLRAVNCNSQRLATLARMHNNANVLCLGARFVTFQNAVKILNRFLNTEFCGERHQRRLKKLSPRE